MSHIAHIKEAARVLARANVPLFLVGAHGIGKTSAIYQMYQEGAKEAGKAPSLDEQGVTKVLAATKVLHPDEVKINVDMKVLSSLDGKHLARAHVDPDAYSFWSMSAPNVSIEEIIGMPHVDDRGAAYREAWFRSQDAAASMLTAKAKGWDIEESANQLGFLTEAIFKQTCERLGITERDRNQIVLRYLRMHALMPDPGHRGGGVWLIDELNRGFAEVEKAMMQILLERRYLDYVVPDNVWIVTTMNPPGGEYQVREMDQATLDRGALMTVSPDKNEWLSWADKRGLSEISQVFVDKNDKLLNKAARESQQAMENLANPGTYRSVEWCDKAFSVMSEEELKNVGLTIAASLLGAEAGRIYYKEATETVHRALSAEDVLKNYGWKESMSLEEEKDYKSWKVTKVRARLKAMVERTNVKTELIRITLNDLQEWVEKIDKDLEKRGSTKNNPKHTKEERGMMLNLLMFLRDIPVDMARHFITDSVDDKFYRLLYWSGHHPVCKDLYDRIETDYQEASKK